MTMPPVPFGPFRLRPAASRLAPVVKRWPAALATLLLVSSGSSLHAAQARSDTGTVPSSPPPQELRTEVETLLQRSERFPQAADWKPLGPQVLGVLERLAIDPKTPPHWRTQAVASMAAVDHPQATDRLQALLQDAGTPPALRASAATALGQRAGPDAVPTLLTFLRDRNESVRAAVAVALGRLGGSRIQQALEERLPLEEAPVVREALQQGLTLVEP